MPENILLPENAFRSLNGPQLKIKDFNLCCEKITKLGNDAFQYLDSLNY
jgi:hypothetical protein